jgi:hypothetical protein
MTPLQDAQRRQGGEARAENQSDADRKFLATLAASRRPLKNDVKMSDDELLRTFREMSKGGPGGGRQWLSFHIVVADGRTIRSTLDDKTVIHRLKLGRGAIGFMGVTFFGSSQKGSRAPSVQVFYKPLKAGTDVIEKLDKAGRAVTAAVIAAIKPVETAINTEVGE